MVEYLAVHTVDAAFPGPEVITFFSFSTQKRMKFILLINVKMPAVVGILTYICRVNGWLMNQLLLAVVIYIRISNVMLSEDGHENSFITSGLGSLQGYMA